jgi:hypothetical protein
MGIHVVWGPSCARVGVPDALATPTTHDMESAE